MAADDMFGSTIALLGRSMDLTLKDHGRIAANIANADTPGYTPTRLSFEKQLSRAVDRKATSSGTTNPRHIPLKGAAGNLREVKGKVIATPAPTTGRDGNGVELEQEMAALSQNQIKYDATVQMLKAKLSGYQAAIKGGM